MRWTYPVPTPGRTRSLAVARLLSARGRATRLAERTRFFIEDLNGAYYPLGRHVRAADPNRDELLRDVRRRLTSVRWMTNARNEALSYLSDGSRQPEDAFGAAAILVALAPEDAATKDVVTGLIRPVQRVLALVFPDQVNAIQGVRARCGARRRPRARPRS